LFNGFNIANKFKMNQIPGGGGIFCCCQGGKVLAPECALGTAIGGFEAQGGVGEPAVAHGGLEPPVGP
jgi:hypothetical protein